MVLVFVLSVEEGTLQTKKKGIYGELRHERVSLGSLDLIHCTRHLCTRFRVDGIKALSRDISGDKQVIKFIYYFHFSLNLAAVPNVLILINFSTQLL